VVCGLWFEVWGLGFGVCGLGFVVCGLWFVGIWDSDFSLAAFLLLTISISGKIAFRY